MTRLTPRSTRTATLFPYTTLCRSGPTPEAVPTASTIKSIAVTGNQRLETQTLRSYLRLRVGQEYDRATLDQALKDLASNELFKDYQNTDDAGALPIDR